MDFSITDEITIVRGEPLTLMLDLPDGCCPGRWEAAEAFAIIISELKKKYPQKTFQFLPFSYENPKDYPKLSLQSILAVAN